MDNISITLDKTQEMWYFVFAVANRVTQRDLGFDPFDSDILGRQHGKGKIVIRF